MKSEYETLTGGDGAGIANGWVEREVAGASFPDERLAKRFKIVLTQLADGTADSIPWACQDWANVNAAHRFSHVRLILVTRFSILAYILGRKK